MQSREKWTVCSVVEEEESHPSSATFPDVRANTRKSGGKRISGPPLVSPAVIHFLPFFPSLPLLETSFVHIFPNS